MPLVKEGDWIMAPKVEREECFGVRAESIAGRENVVVLGKNAASSWPHLAERGG